MVKKLIQNLTNETHLGCFLVGGSENPKAFEVHDHDNILCKKTSNMSIEESVTFFRLINNQSI